MLRARHFRAIPAISFKVELHGRACYDSIMRRISRRPEGENAIADAAIMHALQSAERLNSRSPQRSGLGPHESASAAGVSSRRHSSARGTEPAYPVGMNRRSPRREGVVAVAALAALLCTSGCSRRLHRFVTDYPSVTISAVNVIDIDGGRVLPMRDVHVVNGAIDAIEVAGNRAITGRPVIDGRGKFLIPGLADMHVHHYSGEYSDDDLLLYLVNGVTTVRNMGGSERDLEAKKRIGTGSLIGPRYYTCGPHVGWWIKTPSEARRVVEEQKSAGYDCIKVYSGMRLKPFRAVIETAERIRIPAVGHAQRKLEIDETLELRSIEHIEELLDLLDHQPPNPAVHSPLARKMATRRVFVTPTVGGFDFTRYLRADELERILARPETRFLSPYWYERVTNPRDDAYRHLRRLGYRKAKRMYKLALQYAAFFNREGVPLLLGTDTTGFLVPGFAVHDELETLVAAGLSPRDALRSATSNVADFLGPAHNSGRITVGWRSDLVVLDANPLIDIRNTRRIAGVMIGRRWIDRAAINQILQRLRKR